MKTLHIENSIQTVRDFMSENGVAPSRLSLDAGLSVNTLLGVHNPDWSPRAKTLLVLERYISDYNVKKYSKNYKQKGK